MHKAELRLAPRPVRSAQASRQRDLGPWDLLLREQDKVLKAACPRGEGVFTHAKECAGRYTCCVCES